MNSKEILQSIINEFDLEKFKQFFRSKNGKLRFFNKEEALIDIDNLWIKDYSSTFKEVWKIAEGQLDDGDLIVSSCLVNQKLSERSSKKAQYELGKKILKQEQKDAGIFIFYDNQGDFRFSLIYANYLGICKEWSSFKRFTYFVSKEQTNKTFLKQIGEADFSTLEKIKESFAVEPVTKQFYSEIQNWYFWAMDKIKFPDDYKYSDDLTKDKEIRNATNLIRLITRLIFIWFIKEKGLVPSGLFSKEKLKDVVKEFMADVRSSNYYNAILQNLFFGTLNQKINERKFADEHGYLKNRKEYGVKNLYRYADKFLISKEKVLNLFKDIPFLNGGLFDCLDKEDETGKVIYIDGFSRNPSKQAIIPDYLLFQEKEEKVDLSQYGIGGNKPVRGLIEILNSYNFIIDENTPIDREVALDPELLGKVFENLLASYNPETATTARKATGSYYTPREIVDYMVEESLFKYLKPKLSEIDEVKLKTILSYSDEIPEFTNEEKEKIILAIDEIKIIDPACGSGAFPMGILHKLVYTLQKLDPENKLWFELQYQKAVKETEEVFKQGDKAQREERLKEINEAFDENINYPDYARKLYLIENCIYGVDIQPIATQISKLRFFISLVLDQKINKSKENFGIRALPNLETKFVAANTLIRIDKPKNLFYTKEIEELEEKIKDLRHKYFKAKTRSEKLNYQKKDKELRKNLAQELKKVGFSSDASEKISKFDLYDPNVSANWFDPEWMFGIKVKTTSFSDSNGFDIVIGNPPYIQLQKAFNSKIKYADIYKDQNYQTFDRTGDIYCLFYEKGIQLLKQNGVLCYITSNKWMRAGYGEKLREFFIKQNPLVLIDLGPEIFESSTVDTNILLIQKQNNVSGKFSLKAVTVQKENTPPDIAQQLKEHGVVLTKLTKDAWFIGSDAEQKLKEKIERIGKPLKEWDVNIYYGIKTGLNEAFIISTEKRNEILANCKTEDERKRTESIIKPILRGRDIKRYYYEWAGLWVIWSYQGIEIDKYPSIKEHLKNYKFDLEKRTGGARKLSNGELFIPYKWYELQVDSIAHIHEFENEKVVYSEIVRGPQFYLDTENFYVEATSFLMTGKSVKYICGLLNSLPITYFFKKWYAGGGLGEEGYRYKKAFLENLPLPPITQANQSIVAQIEGLVDKIISTKKQNHLATTSNLEQEIDKLVYKLYDLTEEETEIMEKMDNYENKKNKKYR